ncbi:MAG: hypothetical protein ACPG7U_04330, partial [Holosporaceae bacterium]
MVFMMWSIVLAAFILATTPLCAARPLSTASRQVPSDLPGPWICGISKIRDYKALSDKVKESLKADLKAGRMRTADIAKKYHISEQGLAHFRKIYGGDVISLYLTPTQRKELLQQYGRNKHWLQSRTRQEAAFDFGISERQFKHIKKLYIEQQKKAAQMPSGTHTKEAHQPAKPQAKSTHTGAHMQTGNGLPKDLERLPLGDFLPLYNPKAHIPVPPHQKNPARAQPQQRGVKRPHGAGQHTQTGNALPKHLERVPWQQFLPFYSADAHIPLSP